jgi:hypothetical protein
VKLRKWTKEEALETLKGLAAQAESLKSSRVFSTEHTMWLTKCLETLEEVFGEASRYYLSLAAMSWQIPDGTIIEPWRHGFDYEAAIDAKRGESFIRHLESAKGLLLAAYNYLEERDLDDVYSARDTKIEANLIMKVLNLAEHQLRKVVRAEPKRETEIQDGFQSLLIGAEIAHARESDKIEYSSKTYVPDFTLPKINLAIEVKLCNRSEREKEIIEEINDDILAYQTKYQNLIFVVYDLSCIRDVDKFTKSFETHQNVTVRVVKH